MALVLGLMLCSAARAETSGVVINADGPTFSFNRGRTDGVKLGDQWTVYRRGHQVGHATVQSVSEYTSQARMATGTASARVGDLVSNGAVSGWSKPQTTESRELATMHLGRRALEQARDAYRDLLDQRTQSRDFETPNPAAKANTISDLMNAYNMFDFMSTQWTPGGTYVGNPSFMIMAAGNIVAGQAAMNRTFAGQTVHVSVKVTYWDGKLMDRYADYLAARQGRSVAQALQLKSELYNEKGIGNYTVFEVWVHNTGQLVANLKPFKWHMYLMGADHRPLEAVRYDPALDAALQPGEEVTGNVYFPKVSPDQKKLVVAFENMFGDRGNLEFDR